MVQETIKIPPRDGPRMARSRKRENNQGTSVGLPRKGSGETSARSSSSRRGVGVLGGWNFIGAASYADEWRERRSSRARWGHAVFVLLVFRGPSWALQDLYGDWSAIYRNRIPPYLTLPLAHPFLASVEPLQVTLSFSFLHGTPSSLSARPLPSTLRLLFHETSLLVAFIQPFAMLPLSLFISPASSSTPFSFSFFNERAGQKGSSSETYALRNVPPWPTQTCFTRNYTESPNLRGPLFTWPQNLRDEIVRRGRRVLPLFVIVTCPGTPRTCVNVNSRLEGFAQVRQR